MIIPEEVEAKIRHICSVIHEVEWSGVLFYSYSGSIDNKDLVITCKDIYVMDIGSGAYTEYNEHPSILDFRIQNNLLEENIQEGLIHSHNNMSTFFSGTDMDTLVDEGTNSNHFVSLIVNNAGKYTARVTRKVVRELKAVAHIVYESNSYYNSYNNKKITLDENKSWEEDKQESKTVEEIEYFNLDIEKQDASNPFTEIDDRLREIQEDKKRKEIKPWNSYNSNRKEYTSFNSYNKEKYPNSTPNRWEQGNIFRDDRLNYGYGAYDDFYDDYLDYKYSRNYDNIGFHEVKEEDDELPLCMTEDFDPDLIKSLIVSLLTGDVTVDDKDFDTEEYVKKMDTIYESKFGPLNEDNYPNLPSEVLDDNNKKLESWIGSMVDFLVYTEDKKLLSELQKKYGHEFTEVDTAEICAMDMWNALDKLPKSYVKNVMMDALLNYIPDAAKDVK